MAAFLCACPELNSGVLSGTSREVRAQYAVCWISARMLGGGLWMCSRYLPGPAGDSGAQDPALLASLHHAWCCIKSRLVTPEPLLAKHIELEQLETPKLAAKHNIVYQSTT